MERHIAILLLLFCCYKGANAQTVNATDGSWENKTAWEGTLVGHVVHINKTDGVPGVRLYYQSLKCNNNSTGNSSMRKTASNANNPSGGVFYEQAAIALKNTDPGIIINDVSVGIDGITCDGTSTTVKVGVNSLNPYEIKRVDDNIFKEVNRVSSVSFGWKMKKNNHEYNYSVIYDVRRGINKILIDGVDQDEWSNQQQQALQQSKKQLEGQRKQFDDEIVSYKKLLNTIQSPQLKNKYSTLIDNALTRFNSAYQTALNTQDINKLQQQSEELSIIEESLSTNISGVNKEEEKQASASLQRNSVASNTITSTVTQQEVYQQRTDNYLNAANSSNDAIQQSLNMNLAEINANAAGNRALAQQIQLQQNQNTADAIGNAVGQLADLLIKPKQQEQESSVNENITQSAEPASDPAKSNFSREVNERNDYDREHASEYQNNFSQLRQYSHKIHIDVTPNLLRMNDDRTQQETMDFIAKTIWQYSKTDNFRPHMFVSNIIDEIAFSDSVFYYKCHSAAIDDPSDRYPESYKIDFAETPITYFEIEPGDGVSHYDIYLTVATGKPDEKLQFHLTSEAASLDKPSELINAFIHLAALCHKNTITTNTPTSTTAEKKPSYYYAHIQNNDKTKNYLFGFYHSDNLQQLTASDNTRFTKVVAVVINEAGQDLEWHDYKVRILLKSGQLITNYNTQAASGDYACDYTIGAGQKHYQSYCFHALFTGNDISKIWLVLNDNKAFDLQYVGNK